MEIIQKISIGSIRAITTRPAIEPRRNLGSRFSTRCCSTLLCAVSLMLLACRDHPRTDADLATAFHSNTRWFADLAGAYTAGDVACQRSDLGPNCRIRHHSEAIDSLRSRAHVEEVYVLESAGAADGLWMPVEVYGILSMSSSVRGYVYLKRPATGSVANTLDVFAKGRHYKPLGDGWYLFVAG